MVLTGVRLGEREIAVLEALVSADSLTNCKDKRPAEDRSREHACVKLTILAAGIHGAWKLLEKCCIELTARKLGIELARVHTSEPRTIAASHEVLGKKSRILLPERKERGPTEWREKTLPIRSDVTQEEVSERKMSHVRSRQAKGREGGPKGLLIGGVGSDGRDGDFDQRKVESGDLGVENAATDTVNADAVKVTCYRGEQRNDLDRPIGPKSGEREAAILSATPRKNYWTRGHEFSVNG